MDTSYEKHVYYYKRLSYVNDDVLKNLISLDDEDSIYFTKQFIFHVTKMKVQSIVKKDRENNRIIKNGKASRTDFIANVDDHIVNIEIQRVMKPEKLLPKIQNYQSHAIVSQAMKGKEHEELMSVISIILYEGIYVDDDKLVTKYEYTCRDRESDPYNKIETYLIELGKINRIFKQKNSDFDCLSSFEKICYIIKNNDKLSKDDIIKLQKGNREVEIMFEKLDIFNMDYVDYMTAVNAKLNEEAYNEYHESIGEERGMKIGEERGIKIGEERALMALEERERKNKIQTLLRQIEKVYHVNAEWLKQCTNEQLENASLYFFDGLSYEEFKEKVLS